MKDPRLKCSPEQLIAAKELIATFLLSIDIQPQERAFNLSLVIRASALLRGEVGLASVRDDQIIEALDTAELIGIQAARQKPS